MTILFRDLRFIIPFVMQLMMFASPLFYQPALLSRPVQLLVAINPMTGIINAFRWSILGLPLDIPSCLISVVTTVVLLVFGLFFFRKTERLFADIALICRGRVDPARPPPPPDHSHPSDLTESLMSRPVITLENIGKMYQIGRATHTGSFRETVTDGVSSIFRKFRGLGEDRSKHDDFWALKDVSFEIKQGEAIGLLGRNGAGKSTLLKVLSRITEPTTGVARLRGRVGSLLEVGTGFHPELTGRENIFLNGSILGMKRAEINQKFDEIVAFSEVERFLDTPVKRYSSGMYIRLAFAVAAHLEPEILLVDEVLAVGDLEFQKKCLGKMNDVVGHGRTVVFVSHHMESISP